MKTWTVPALLGAGMIVVGVIFTAAPGLDLDVATAFYRGGNSFVAQTPAGETVRRVLYWVPTAALLGYAALYLAKRFGRVGLWAPTARGLLFLSLSFVLGPGVLVNTVLKDHSHRPRPNQTRDFGGESTFRPFHSFNGECARNCSFVSGEGAAGAWTLAPALLLPTNIRAGAIAASMIFAACVGLLRMAFGGHYLSDTLFAFLITWTVVWLLWRAIVQPPLRPPSDAVGSPAGGPQ